jgi:mRNA interferase RelE/StbE
LELGLYKIIPHKKVIKFISSRIPKEKQQIKRRFDELAKNPYPTNQNLNIKKMIGQTGFRLRIGGYRFIYDIVDSELVIYMENVDNRGDIY